MRTLSVFLLVVALDVCQAQTSTPHAPSAPTSEALIIKWDSEVVPHHRHEERNAVVYYLQIGKSVYKVTRESTRPDLYLVSGEKKSIRIEANKVYIPDDKGKEVKYKVLGVEPVA